MIRRGTLWAMVAVALVGLSLVGAPQAQAGLLPTLTGVSGPDGFGDYTFSYDLIVPAPVKVAAGDYFTIYDFNGFVPASDTSPVGWVFSTAAVTPPPSGVAPSVDSAAVANLTWTYFGPDIFGLAILPGFSAKSDYSSVYSPPGGLFNVASVAHEIVSGKAEHAVSTTDVPQAPEPATLAMLGCGLPFLGLVVRRRRQA